MVRIPYVSLCPSMGNNGSSCSTAFHRWSKEYFSPGVPPPSACSALFFFREFFLHLRCARVLSATSPLPPSLLRILSFVIDHFPSRELNERGLRFFSQMKTISQGCLLASRSILLPHVRNVLAHFSVMAIPSLSLILPSFKPPYLHLFGINFRKRPPPLLLPHL